MIRRIVVYAFGIIWAAPFMLVGLVLSLTVMGIPIALVVFRIGVAPFLNEIKRTRARREQVRHDLVRQYGRMHQGELHPTHSTNWEQHLAKHQAIYAKRFPPWERSMIANPFDEPEPDKPWFDN